jgi:hypothetical protein
MYVTHLWGFEEIVIPLNSNTTSRKLTLLLIKQLFSSGFFCSSSLLGFLSGSACCQFALKAKGVIKIKPLIRCVRNIIKILKTYLKISHVAISLVVDFVL